MRIRIVTDCYLGYEVQTWRWWLPVWIQGSWNTHGSLEQAERYANKLYRRKRVVKYLDFTERQEGRAVSYTYLDCGCAINSDGHRHTCPTCASGRGCMDGDCGGWKQAALEAKRAEAAESKLDEARRDLRCTSESARPKPERRGDGG